MDNTQITANTNVSLKTNVHNYGIIENQKVVNIDTVSGNVVNQSFFMEADIEHFGKNPELYFNNGIRLLEKGLYKNALTSFEKAILYSYEGGDVFYYAALCMLNGERPFLVRLPIIKKAEDYLDKAIKIERKGIYYFLKSLIHSDFYEMKKLRSEPSSSELMAYAEINGISEAEKNQIRMLLEII